MNLIFYIRNISILTTAPGLLRFRVTFLHILSAHFGILQWGA
jgi:hypothetical protein